MHFPPSDRKKSNPSHEFAGDRKNLLTMMMKLPRFDDIETNLSPNRSNDPFSAFCPLSFLGNFLCLFIFSACRPIVCSVCLFYIFLLLFSNKMKSSFLFYGDTKLFFTKHTDKYRMNDVTIIYRIGPLYILI